ncbi:TPA: hypothetical protein ACGXK0_003566 [Bacillus cereus]|uniref:hypothetical protein n=1 Tax=Bacillus cereus TaxID=1396 RepID=UPI000BF30381|nr:hypothetical protein [Bacillus cereus]PFL47408.1 hypothetical protein COJ34_20440 [Bacillus cereus]PFQ99260.1 hypothetical protein COK32_05180 [Bacillus cereus]
MENRKLDSAIIIFIITIAGYGIAGLYEMGYKSFYHLPNKLIDFNATTIINALFSVGIMSIVGMVFNFMPEEIKKSESVKKFYHQFFYRGEANDQFRFTKKTYILFLITTIVLIGLIIQDINHIWDFIIWILLLGSVVFVLRNSWIISAFLLFLLISVCSYRWGYIQAQQKKEYVALKNQNLIIVDYYKDKAIIAKADFKKKLIYPEYQFIKLESSKPNEQKFELKYTGFMEMKK